MRKSLLTIIGGLLVAGLMLGATVSHAQVPHTILAMLRDDAESAPPANEVKFQAYIKDVSDGGVHSETRTDDDTGNAYGDGVMGDGWLELECANFTQFEWAHGDSLRLAIVNTETDQFLVTSIELNAAVEPQLADVLYLESSVQNFQGGCSENEITVEWFLEGYGTDLVFHVYRSTSEEGPYERISTEPLEPQEPGHYFYCDQDITPGPTYYYMLGLAEFGDNVIMFGPISVTARTDVAAVGDVAVPGEYGISQNYPNPFNPETTIQYQVPEITPVNIAVYNLLGQQVRTLVDEVEAPGYHRVVWDGRDSGGNRVASGIYFCHLTAGSYHQTKKMTLLK